MKQDDIFSADQDTIDIGGIDGIVQFARYKPHDPDGFMDGMELAEDLMTKSGTTLYTKGTQISPDRVARILKLRESNPNLEIDFKIKRSAKLIQQFRSEIKGQMNEMLKRRQGVGVYSGLLSHIGDNIEGFVDEILTDENVTLSICKMKLISDSSETKSAAFYFNHSLNVALFSLAMASSERFKNILGNDKSKLVEICKVGLFHNYGAITQIDTILKAEKNKKFRMYWDANRNGYFALGSLRLSFEIMDAIRFLGEYYMDRKDFVERKEWPATMANIVLVAEMFLRKESGLFGAPQGVRDVVDFLNVKMIEKEVNEMVVQILTLGLNLQDIFDFYQELERLEGKCPHGKSGVPYPLTGFKSPTLFVCKNEVLECEHIEGSLYAVNLMKSIGELKSGKYRRCWLMTRLLSAFYKGHYKEIKDTDTEKDTK